MKIRSIGAVLLTGALLAIAPPAAPPAAASPSHSACRPGTPPPAPQTTRFYDPARPELGPDPLPYSPPVGPLLIGYDRFGGLTEAQFIATYRSGTSWIYPPDDGFLVIAGRPHRYPFAFKPGTRVDRFGYPGGGYLAPARSLFSQRALPPQNLNTPAGATQANYHLYCVLRSFTVDAGLIAPWFAQPGLGIQYKLEQKYQPSAGGALSVAWLVQHGYLVEERPGT